MYNPRNQSPSAEQVYKSATHDAYHEMRGVGDAHLAHLSSKEGFSSQTRIGFGASGKLFKSDIREDGDKMTISREEFDAKLAQSKAEINASNSEIRREMAEWREQQNSQIAQLTSAISSLSSKIDGKMDSVDGIVKSFDGKIEGIQGQITGMNTAISGIQSGISTRLAIFGVIIALIVAIPGLISVFKDSPQSGQLQPVIIQLPAQQTITPPTTQQQKPN